MSGRNTGVEMRTAVILALLIVGGAVFFDGPVQAQNWDPKLRVEVQLPPILTAATDQRMTVVLSGTENKPIVVRATARRATDGAESAVELFRQRFTSDGAFTPAFSVPTALIGNVRITIVAEKTGGGFQSLFFDTTIAPPELTTTIVTDKPLYQPGQTVFIRTISFSALTQTAAADRELILEVRNPLGILVWAVGNTEKFSTDQFGVAAMEFRLAADVPTGIYTISVRMGPNRTDHEILVRRYQLPKFIIAIEPSRPFFLRGSEVRAKIRTTYTFGEPVKNGSVTVSLIPFDAERGTERAALNEMTGTLDADGQWTYTFSLPQNLDAQFAGGDSFPLAIRVRVEDEGGLIEMASAVRTVAKHPIRVEMFPENNVIVSGVENRVFVFASFPDGTPARASLNIRDRNLTVATTEQGVGEFMFTPKAGDQGKEFFEAEWHFDVLVGVETTPVKWKFSEQTASPKPHRAELVLRPVSTLLSAEENPTFQLLLDPRPATAAGLGTVTGYLLEVRKNGYTVDIKPVSTTATEGFACQLPPSLFGQIDFVLHERRRLEAAAGSEPKHSVRRNVATASVFRRRGDAIDVHVRPGADTYRPRQAGEIVLSARRQSGQPGPVVMGVDIVDTAIFGLTAEERERFELAFMLDRSLLDARWRSRIGDPSMSDATREMFSAAVFSRFARITAGGISADSQTFADRRTDEVLDRLRELLTRYRHYFYFDGHYRQPFEWLKQHAEETGYTDEDRRDAWNNEIQLLESYAGQKWVLVSPGPDGRLNAEKADAPENADNRTR